MHTNCTKRENAHNVAVNFSTKVTHESEKKNVVTLCYPGASR